MLFAAAVALAPVAPVDLDQEARAIEAMLVAPCCWTQQVSEHQSEAAEQIKREVRASLAAGRSRTEIVDAYVAQYGERILVVPRAHGFNLVLYLLPVFTLVVSAGGIAWLVRRMSRRAEAPEPAPAPAGSDPAAEAELDRELDEID